MSDDRGSVAISSWKALSCHLQLQSRVCLR